MIKKKLSVLAAAALVGATAQVGITGTASASSSVVTIPMPANPAISTLDPSNWGAQILIDQGTVMEGLFGYSPTGQIVPKIASSYTVTNGGKTWTFFLRHNAKWSNGQPVTAEDFYYSWLRTASPKNTNDAIWASVMQFVANAYNYHGGGVPASQVGVKVINPYEIQIQLTSPHNMLGTMVLTGAMPLYPPSVEAHPNNWFLPQYFVSDAPYTVKTFTPDGEITLTKNPDYVPAPGQSVGNVQTIDLVPAPTVPVEDYLAGRLNAAVITQPSDYKYVQEHSSLRSQLHVQPDNQIVYLEWDKSVVATPLDNVSVRQAIEMAIDRTPIVNNVLQGMGAATDTFGYKGWPTNSLQKPFGYNLPKAKALLAKAGYPGGKGLGTITLYAEVASTTPTSIPVAEAVQEELKQGLGINSVITPEATTEYGNIVWGGLNQGIQPGYIIGQGTPNWSDTTSLPIQSNQQILFAGTVGPLAYRQHISNYYFPTWDPTDVAQLGNPDDASMGVTFAQWQPMVKAAEADIKYLNAYDARQPAAYKATLIVPGQATDQQQWDNYVKGWQTAKTAADKHAAWVAAWKFVGDWSAGNGGANVGLNGQVWDDQHMPNDVYQATMWNAELGATVNLNTADQLAANLDNYMLQQGYGVPLYDMETFYLESPGLSGIEANPWSWGNLFQLQYLAQGGNS